MLRRAGCVATAAIVVYSVSKCFAPNTSESGFFSTAHVYPVYCQVRVKEYLDNQGLSLVNLDSFEAVARDSEGNEWPFALSAKT